MQKNDSSHHMEAGWVPSPGCCVSPHDLIRWKIGAAMVLQACVTCRGRFEYA